MTETFGLEALTRFVKGRRVALVGNAQSLLENPKPELANYDVIVRMNRGMETASKTGCDRTDILLLSAFTELLPDLITQGAKIVYMSPAKRDRIPPEHKAKLHFYPVDWWEELHTAIGERPSTGCMGIHMMARMIESGSLHLYGFDFWRSPTAYNMINRPGPHSPSAEERFAMDTVGRQNVH